MNYTKLGLVIFMSVMLHPCLGKPSSNQDLVNQMVQRQENMETELRELRGRVETLEHKLQTKEARDHSSSTNDSLPDRAKKTKVHVYDHANRSSDSDEDGTRYFLPPEQKEVSSPEDKFTTARNLITTRQYDEAKTLLKEVIEELPKDKLSIDSYYWLGEIEFINGRYEAAAVSFGDSYGLYEKLKKTDPSVIDSKAPNSLIQLSRCFNKLEKREKALATLKQVDTEFPDHPKKLIGMMAKRARKEIDTRRSVKPKD